MRSETSSQNKFMSKTKDHITYYVQGMHCAACESLIEKAISGGVVSSGGGGDDDGGVEVDNSS